MPLGFRLGDTSDSRLCGVETEFDYGMERILQLSCSNRGFDFVVAPLINPAYRPSLSEKQNVEQPEFRSLPVTRSDHTVSPTVWNEHVVGKISSWIDLDSEDETLRVDSETVLRKEIARASYLSLQACLLPSPKGTSCVNYARCVNQILQGLKRMQFWLRIPLGNPNDDSRAISGAMVDSWEIWNYFRQLCEHHNRLWVALDTLSTLPSENSLQRWFGEPVSAAILHINDFLTNGDIDDFGLYLPKRHQELITRFFDHSIQIVISGEQGPLSTEDLQRYRIRQCLEHVGDLYKQVGSLPEKERLEFGLRDALQSPSQPLTNNMDSLKYQNLEKDAAKYTQYAIAICQALMDRVPDEMASETTTVLMVIGAGRGPLVQASLHAAKCTKRKLKVYAVEKNPDAIVALNQMIELENYADIVTVVSSDMRYWNAPEAADILVSDLLGSFGDNELSPECLDGAQRFLKEDGISIPSSYTSFLQPVTASKLYTNLKGHTDVSRSEASFLAKIHKVMEHKNISHFEAAYFAKLHNVARLSPSKPVFTFTHPKHLENESNRRYKKLRFVIPKSTGSAMVHGFAGYFDATLYKDVHIGSEPSTATPNLLSWFAMFFPLRTPVCVDRGSTLEVHFWRCCDSKKVWYEWCVTSPSLTPVYNSNGRSYRVEL